jgi:hypothetical protein
MFARLVRIVRPIRALGGRGSRRAVRAKRLAGRLALPLLLALAQGCASSARRSISVRYAGAVVVLGLSDSELNRFDALGAQHRNDVLRVHVAEAGVDAPPLLGDVARRDGSIVFTPKYPLREGLAYRARFDAAAVGGIGAIESVLKIPAPSAAPVVHVGAVYPSADELPENLLKFYIHFTGPMSRGEAYERVRLLDEDGREVSRPFLELGEELWNQEMTRFTLFFEPGRIKQGLVPRREMGLALTRGKTYTLEVDASWQDDRGRPLVETFRKTFQVAGPDARQPDPARWIIEPPAAGSLDPVGVRFDESLDHGMLQHVITVRDAAAKAVPGKVAVSEKESRWSFTPTQEWRAERHVLVVETILEDSAGNSIGRPFEVDLNQTLKVAPASIEIPFEVGKR